MSPRILSFSAALMFGSAALGQITWNTQTREVSAESYVNGDMDDASDDAFQSASGFSPFVALINATATTRFDGDLIVMARQNSSLLAAGLTAQLGVESEVRIAVGTEVYGFASSECSAGFTLVAGGRRVVLTGNLGLGEGASGNNSLASVQLDGPGGLVYLMAQTVHGAAPIAFDQALPDGQYVIRLITELEHGDGDGDINGFINLQMDLVGGCAADFNGSGSLTVQDIFDFLVAYFSNDSAADINNSGSITVQDIFDYLTAYFTGC